MFPYICLSYATANRAEADQLMHILTKYGFCHRSVNEETDPLIRVKHLTGAVILLAMTSPQAETITTVAEDLRCARDLRCPSVCVSLAENGLDNRFCALNGGATEDSATRIPYPAGQSHDAHTVARVMHELFVCRLCRIDGIFLPTRCTQDVYGTLISHAVRAYAGSRESAYALGCAYEAGEYLPMMEYEASRWISMAAEAGLPDACLHMGEFRLTGWGVEPDISDAFRLFSQVAAGGDVRGEYRVGLCYLNGVGVVKDPAQAVRYLQVAARWNYAPALYRLGILCRDGIGTPVNTRAAMTYFYEACRQCRAREDDAHELPVRADGSHAPTLYACRSGKRGVLMTVRDMRRRTFCARMVTNPTRGWHQCRVRASEHPEDAWIHALSSPSSVALTDGMHTAAHPAVRVDRDEMAMEVPFDVSSAALALGRILECGSPEEGLYPHPTRALVWYRFALSRGNTEAIYRLAEAYRRGIGTPRDPVGAVSLYRMAAERGDARGQFVLATCYERGTGVKPDMDEAVRLYQQAAEAGHAPAQNNLGGCYEYGIGVPRNDTTAAEWYVRAAGAGHPDALCRLGLCYENGRGVPQDRAQAVSYYQSAARLGHGYALYRLGVCHSYGIIPDASDADGTSSAGAPQYGRAVELWEAAAALGVSEAAYALSVAYTHGQGVRIDRTGALRYLHMAVAGNQIQAYYRLGLAFLEGDGEVKNEPRAELCFERTVALWHERRALYNVSRDRTSGELEWPPYAISPAEAAAGALYMLGYCALRNTGDGADTLTEEQAKRIKKAETCFRGSATLGHVGALTALGDMAAHGLLSDGEIDPAYFYEEAIRISSLRASNAHAGDGRRNLSPTIDLSSTVLSPADCVAESPVHALMSLSRHQMQQARALSLHSTENDTGTLSALRSTVWKQLAAAVEQGSGDALVDMAECLYFGHGVSADVPASMRLLERAEHMRGGRMAASMWLGDFLRGHAGGNRPTGVESRLEEADAAYMRALQSPFVDSEVGPYALDMRRAERMAEDCAIRAEVLYRLATFRSVYFSDDPERNDTFPYLAQAVLMDHDEARDDLARIYDYESSYSAVTVLPDGEKQPLSLRERMRGNRVHRRLQNRTSAETVAVNIRSHSTWMTDYYTALWPEPMPFCRKLCVCAPVSDLPAHISKPVTPLMRVASLNYLGDCLFYGRGLTKDPAAAVACYREVVETNLNLPHGEPLPSAVIWAQYSLGWCLLYGCGVKKNAREAVRWLTMAARTHAEANYVLGACYECGDGVDAADAREAIKYYRKALRLGYGAAEVRIADLEKHLKGEA